MSGTTKSCLRVLGVALVAPLMLGQACTPTQNRPPVAVAAATPTIVPSGGSGSLSGSASTDPDNDSLTYSWTVITGTATLTNPTSALAGFTAPATTTNLTLVFQLTVSDGRLSSSSTVTIAVTGSGPSSILVLDQVVSVAGGGGFAQVVFNATSGQRIRITLTGVPNNMEPYGNLEYPDGNNVQVPPINTAVNGTNMADVTLNPTGEYRLDVFDGANAGGNVTVRIELL